MSGHAARSPSTSPEERPRRPRLRLVYSRRVTPELDVVRPGDEAEEARLVRRARRQALALMIGSTVFSLAVLYGLWALAARFI